MSRPYLLVLGERCAIGWVLREQRMAFPATPRAEVRSLAAGDRLYLYSTRGAWRNPTRDRGRVFAYAKAESSVQALDQPVEIADRSFHSACSLHISGLVAYRGGVELQPLVHHMAAFPKPQAWSIYLRRPLLRLSEDDAALLDKELSSLLRDRAEVVSTYPW